jgi:N-acetylmuramoyl-L-alanine amidase
MSDAPITDKFKVMAPVIMGRLMSDARIKPPLSEEDAAAILGNIGTETGGFSLRQEAGKPNKDSTGFGWCQWTGMDEGERRLLFETWCDENGFDNVVDDPDGAPEDDYNSACYGYLVHELVHTWEKRAIVEDGGGTISGVYYPPLCKCTTLDAKAESFCKLFERPGTPHMDWRLEMAHEALRLYRGGEPEEVKMYPRIVISSGHGKIVRGASGILDEVDEARKVVESVATELRNRGIEVTTFHDDTSTPQNENLNTIVNFHNSKTRDLDISVHFNAYVETTSPMGTEVLYYTQQPLAAELSAAMAEAGQFINRGPKKRTDLFFLNSTEEPAVLLEVCFVDSTADANIYHMNHAAICDAIADVLGGADEEEAVPPPVEGEIPRPPRPVRPPPIPGQVNIEISGNVVVTVNGVPV